MPHSINEWQREANLSQERSERKRGGQGQPRSTPEPYAQIGPVRIDPALRRRLDEHLTTQSVTLRAFVERAVARELERKQ